MKKWIVPSVIVVVLVLAAAFATSVLLKDTQKSSESAKTADTAPSAESAESAATEGTASEKHHVNIEVEDYGTISAELDADAAPITVANFLDLAGSGFYDGLTFHRIIDGFMIQGGDPLGNGTGGSDKTIKGEFKSNGVDNPISHTRGTISMARSSDKDSASSQFFIVQSDSTFLDGDYAAFGEVLEGMDIVDKICKDAMPLDSNGAIAADKQPVIKKIEVID